MLKCITMKVQNIFKILFLIFLSATNAYAEDYKKPFGVELGKVIADQNTSAYTQTASYDLHASFYPEKESKLFASYDIRVSKSTHTAISVAAIFDDKVSCEEFDTYIENLRVNNPELKADRGDSIVLHAAPYIVYTGTCIESSKYSHTPKDLKSGLSFVIFSIGGEKIRKLLYDEQGEWEELTYFSD